jgi:hypothetical protein
LRVFSSVILFRIYAYKRSGICERPFREPPDLQTSLLYEPDDLTCIRMCAEIPVEYDSIAYAAACTANKTGIISRKKNMSGSISNEKERKNLEF